jgi:hypothetical protein
MIGTNFVAAVTKYGEGNLICLMFNNSGRKVFTKLEFTLAENYDAVNEILIFKEKDGYGNEFINTEPVGAVQNFTFATAKTKRDQIDTRFMG